VTNPIHLESALRILLAHRSSRAYCRPTRRLIKDTILRLRLVRMRDGALT